MYKYMFLFFVLMSSYIFAQVTSIPWGISQPEYTLKFGDQYNTSYKGLDFLICNDSIKCNSGLYKTLEINAFAKSRLVKRIIILWEQYGNANDLTALNKYCNALADVSGSLDKLYGQTSIEKIWLNKKYNDKTDADSVAKATALGYVKYHQEWMNNDTKVTLTMGCPKGDGEVVFVVQYYSTNYKDVYTSTAYSPDDWGF